MPLARWLWRSYMRAAVVPLLVIELSFLAVYWASNLVTYDTNAESVGAISTDTLHRTARREAIAIAEKLSAISDLTDVYAAETGRALVTPYDPPAEEKARYAMSPDGVFHTTRDNGTTATFFSGIVPVGPQQMETVWRTAQIDPLMKAIKDSNPLIAQLYFNTKESYNRIYPYFDVLSQYAPKMDIPSFNFYYEADAAHNPERKAVWTDAYIDPAGSGWMVSSIAPVYLGDSLEAVVGIDVTIDTIVNAVLDLDLPWNAYALLVGRDGTILALPPRGESDWSLQELTGHHYAEAIKQNTFKPEDFNILKRADSKALAEAMTAAPDGIMPLDLKGARLASWASIPGPGWKLIVIAPESEILAHATQLREKMSVVGYGMVAILLAFYGVFFMMLYRRAREMSQRVAKPLEDIETLISQIGDGEYDHAEPDFTVTELQTVGSQLVGMGRRLGEAYAALVEAEQTVRQALDKERNVSEMQRQFINVVSHEFRTPLAIIDSTAQTLGRRPEKVTAERLSQRCQTLRAAVRRITEVMDSAMNVLKLEEGRLRYQFRAVAPAPLLVEICDGLGQTFPDHPITLDAGTLAAEAHWDAAMIRAAIAAVIENAAKYAPAGSAIAVSAGTDPAGKAVIAVTDHGRGIPPDELPRVFERFFRGSETTDSHGAGIGLYLAREFIALHGGSIAIDSTPGQGTTVTLSIPLHPATGTVEAA